MNSSVYELNNTDVKLPVIFHYGIKHMGDVSYMHWHEGIEILYVLSGSMKVSIDSAFVSADEHELVIVNTNQIHDVAALNNETEYYCLIVNNGFCKLLGIDTEESYIYNLVKDERIEELYKEIISEWQDMQSYHKPLVKGIVIQIVSLLLRHHTETDTNRKTTININKLNMVKEAISYLNEHYSEQISVDNICATLGFSKYYFCHTFKEITQSTLIAHLNYIRCHNAARLFATTHYNVSEVAEACGFRNASYFTKTFKSIMGTLPSKS